MPLRALIDGGDVVAPLLAPDEWETLRADVRAKRVTLGLPCCETHAFPRVSKLGTRHFVHRRAHGCSGSGETFQHLWLKTEILRACAAAGWEARPEVAGDGWRADVLASRGGARVAFEVQWSAQDHELFRLRQERYAAAGVRACWLYRGAAPGPESVELPVFALELDAAHVAVVEAGGHRLAPGEFVGRLLGRRVRFTPSLTTRLRVSFIYFPCWKCRTRAHVYYSEGRSRCGAIGVGSRIERQEYESWVHAQAQRWLAGEGRRTRVRLGAVKRRWSNTMRESYVSFGCPECDALFGDHFVHQAILEARLDDDADASFEVELAATGTRGHWCSPPTGIPLCGVAHAPGHASTATSGVLGAADARSTVRLSSGGS